MSIQALSQTTKKKTSKFNSGFCLAIKEQSKKQGTKQLNTDDYFVLLTQNGMTFKNIDTVYNELNRNCDCYLLTIKFNKQGTKELLDFSTKSQNQTVGLVLNGRLLITATMFEPIYYGGLTLASSFTKDTIDEIQSEILKEARIQKLN